MDRKEEVDVFLMGFLVVFFIMFTVFTYLAF